MNRKQKKTLFILVGVLVVLVAILLIIKGVQSRQEEAEAAQAAEENAASLITEEHPYSSITYTNGSTTLSFTLAEDGTWQWADDPDFPLDQSNITSIVDLISGLKPQQTITEGDTLEAYGLDAPVATLTATSDEDGTTLTMALGNTTTDGNSYYMMMNGDESTVYIISSNLYEKMSVAIYDMMILPEMPDLSEENLVSVTVEGAVSTTLTAQQTQVAAAEDETDSEDATDEDSTSQTELVVTWSSDGTDVTENETVTSLLSDLGSMSIASCVDFKPTDEAVEICGFTAPSAVLTVQYTDETGAEQTLTLTVGSVMPGADSDSESRYVRVNDDTTLYEMSGSSLDALLTLAQTGLG